jgi:hypothetical protein
MNKRMRPDPLCSETIEVFRLFGVAVCPVPAYYCPSRTTEIISRLAACEFGVEKAGKQAAPMKFELTIPNAHLSLFARGV